MTHRSFAEVAVPLRDRQAGFTLYGVLPLLGNVLLLQRMHVSSRSRDGTTDRRSLRRPVRAAAAKAAAALPAAQCWRGCEMIATSSGVRLVTLAAGSRYFLSGVMQGRKADGDGVAGTVPQDYRGIMRDAIETADPAATVIEPWDLVGELCARIYPEGTPQDEMFRDDAHVREAFECCVEAAAAADVVVSYLPEASMGSAVEIYAARAAGKTILAVAPGSMVRGERRERAEKSTPHCVASVFVFRSRVREGVDLVPIPLAGAELGGAQLR